MTKQTNRKRKQPVRVYREVVIKDGEFVEPKPQPSRARGPAWKSRTSSSTLR
jgi:hypothetical protein